MATWRLKSFDYRVLNLVLYALRREEPDPHHMDFLGKSEVLVELGDDLADYTQDVEANTFNTYRCFVALYGPERASLELTQFIHELEADYAAALARLDPTLACSWRKRCEAVTRHGTGSDRGPGGGRWDIPTPCDETHFRRR